MNTKHNNDPSSYVSATKIIKIMKAQEKEVKMYNQNVPLSVRSKGHFLGPWAYAQTAIERTLKG